METAGKLVDNEDMREIMKENGIGRPSTRANIIETLFKRKYIERKKKNIHATTLGIQLIGTIKNDLLKSPELTGQWENKLRQIEKGQYTSNEFKSELYLMIRKLTDEVVFR
jgi:DNA topoisomerase-3